MKFGYTALSADNQKLTGVLEAENMEAAKGELHKMGVSIIDISEVSEEQFEEKTKTVEAEKKKTGIQSFTFECVDPNGKEVNGTIDAKDAYAAYRRLVTEYHFKVNNLYPTGSDEAATEAAKANLLTYAAQLKAEGVDIEAMQKQVKVKSELEMGEKKIDEKAVEEIDKFIVNTKKILEVHAAHYSPPFLAQIEKTLDELERVRTSNNLKHIREVCGELYELVSHPDNEVPKGPEGPEEAEFSGIVDTLKGSSFIRREFDLHAEAVNLSKIRGFFDKIIEALKRGEKKKAQEGKKVGTLRTKFRSFLEGLAKKFERIKAAAPAKPAKAKAARKSKFGDLFSRLKGFLTAPNKILRQTRGQELKEAWGRLFKRKPKKPVEAAGAPVETHRGASQAETPTPAEPMPAEAKPVGAPMEAPIGEPMEGVLEEGFEEPEKPRRDYTAFYTEMDSFVGWLLFFYIVFFFLVNFSLEKSIGIPQSFVAKTLKTPLIFNVTLFLLFAHLILRIKNLHFRRNWLGSAFLFVLGFGIYAILVLNF